LHDVQVLNYKIAKLQMKNEKLQPTNNNVSKFTSNKTHACIAKLQVYKFTNLQFASYNIK
jgi:hypothetical protein